MCNDWLCVPLFRRRRESGDGGEGEVPPVDQRAKRYHPPGPRPGTLAVAGAPAPVPPKLHLIDYTDTEWEEIEGINPEACRAYLDRDSITWIHSFNKANRS